MGAYNKFVVKSNGNVWAQGGLSTGSGQSAINGVSYPIFDSLRVKQRCGVPLAVQLEDKLCSGLMRCLCIKPCASLSTTTLMLHALCSL